MNGEDIRITMSLRDYHDRSIVLLGPSKFTWLREKVRTELLTLNYREVIIMELYPDSKDDITFDDKFRRMLNDTSPDTYIAFFHKGEPMDGVTFEIGWLCGTLSILDIAEKLILMGEGDYNMDDTTSYIPRLMTRVGYIQFNESRSGLEASTLIDAKLRSPIKN